MLVYYYKYSGKNMVIQATLQTKLACGTLTIIIVNVCVLIAIIAFVSKNEMCKLSEETKNNDSTRRIYRRAEYNPQTIAEYPWILAFIVLPDCRLIGGGTIISKYWALTTAACVHNISFYPMSKIAFRGGSSFWNKNGFHHFVSKLISHQKFNLQTLDYDIALAQVTRPFVYTNEEPISVAGNNFKLLEDNFAKIVGWTHQEKEKNGPYLLSNNVKIVNHNDCTKTLKRMKNKIKAPASLCTYNIANDHYSCTFASGSALIANKSIIGVVSWGAKCDESRWPGVHVDVEKVVKWLQEIKKKEHIPMSINY